MADTSIRFGDEDPAVGTFKVSNMVTSFTLNAPMICADVGTATGPFAGNKIVATWPGASAGNGNFLFGPVSGNSTLPVSGLGSWTFSPVGGLTIAQSDPALVCYALSAAGVRKPSIGLFSDDFDPALADAKVALRVVQLPTADNFYVYKYYLDVTIPVVSSAVTVPFVIQDGYDSSVFTAVNYCQVDIGQTSCGSTTAANVNVPVTLLPNQSYSKRFIVQRQLRSGLTSLPATGSPVVLAAVFAPNDLDTALDNNIAAGFTALSDFTPTITTTGTDLSGLVEGGTLLARSFSLSDDTTESAGNLLGATVSIDYNGDVVSVPVDCGSSTPVAGAPNRTCSFDVVPPTTDFATDGVTAGTYVAGVSATVIITAHDARGQESTTTLPLHVASGDNDPPVFDIDETLAPVDGTSGLPTITCSAQAPQSPGCIGLSSAFVKNLAPASPNSVDELKYQGAALNLGGAAGSPNYYYLSCLNETGSIFALSHGVSGAPSASRESGNTSYALDYNLNMTPGSTLCTVSARDGSSYPNNGFPNGQSVANTTKQFRIVVTN